MSENIRYSRLTDIIDMATYMASKVQGITIENIQERYNVSRRTAERMRDSLMIAFPQIDEIETDDTKKHWGFSNYSISYLVNFDPKEIVNLEQLQRRTTNKELKKELNNTIEKIKAFNRKNALSTENKIELFMQTEGYAVRQMPKYEIDINRLETVRTAMQNSKKIICTYNNKKRVLEPLGMIYGDKIYLIARDKKKGNDIYTFLLHKFEEIRLSTESFDKGDFNLQEYSNKSFGVYHGEILDVKLRFSPEAKPEAIRYNFHPTQKIKEEKDGSLIVTFKASGDKEIMWHVFKWGKDCSILAPKSLKDEYKKYLKDVLDAQ